MMTEKNNGIDQASGNEICQAINEARQAITCLDDAFRRTTLQNVLVELFDASYFLGRASLAVKQATARMRHSTTTEESYLRGCVRLKSDG